MSTQSPPYHAQSGSSRLSELLNQSDQFEDADLDDNYESRAQVMTAYNPLHSQPHHKTPPRLPSSTSMSQSPGARRAAPPALDLGTREGNSHGGIGVGLPLGVTGLERVGHCLG